LSGQVCQEKPTKASPAHKKQHRQQSNPAGKRPMNPTITNQVRAEIQTIKSQKIPLDPSEKQTSDEATAENPIESHQLTT
jgi:hypothetical protein